MMKYFYIVISLSVYVLVACKNTATTSSTIVNEEAENQKNMSAYQNIGSIDRLSPALDKLIDENAKIEILASGFDWSEGPVWVDELDALLFSDIPPNNIYIWKEGETKASVFLNPSGYTSDVKRGGEVGANGLIVNIDRQLVMCQHGDRRIARLATPWNNVSPSYETIADNYMGKKFNSPNDVIQKSNGNYYFTDPPYGLEFQATDPARELDYQGVFMSTPDGAVSLLTKTMTRPNGLAFSPDESILYVANSDPEKSIWNAFDVNEDGTLTNERVFFDVTGRDGKGLPDGMKVDKNGNIYATGQGGVYVFDAKGTQLGLIRTTEATSNCAFGGPNNDYLYMTCDMHLMRVKLKSAAF